MKNLAILVSCLLPFLPPSAGYAQRMAEIAREKPVVKLSMLPLFHFDNAFVVGAEIPLKTGQISLQPEIGLGAARSSIWYPWWYDEPYPDKNTFRSKIQFRSYFMDGRVFRAYFGGEYAYIQNTYRQQFRAADAPNVTVVRDVTLRRATHAVHGLMGWQGYFSSRLTLDFHVGFGMRAPRNFSVTRGLPTEELEQIQIDDQRWFGRSRKLGRFGPYPDLIAAFQLGFVLGKIQK